MKQDDKAGHDEPLHALLQTWQVNEPLPPRFAEGVWRRIALSEVRETGFGFKDLLAPLLRWWELAVRRPVFAAAYLGVFLAIGLSVGFWQAETYAHSTEAAWRTAYVRSVTPTATFQP